MFILPLYSDKKKCIQFVNMVYYKKSNYNQYNHCNHISSTVCFMVQSKVASLRRNIDHLFWWELSLFSKCHFAFLSLRSFDLWCGSFKTKFEKKKICFHIFRRQHYMIIGWVNRLEHVKYLIIECKWQHCNGACWLFCWQKGSLKTQLTLFKQRQFFDDIRGLTI